MMQTAPGYTELGLSLPKDIIKRLPEWKAKEKNIYTVQIDGLWFVFRAVTLNETQTFLRILRYERLPQLGDIRHLVVGRGSAPHLAKGVLRRYVFADSEVVAAQEYLLNTSVLYPDVKSLDSCQQGVVASLLECVVEVTGFTQPNTFMYTLENSREAFNNNIEDIVACFICKATGIKPDEVYDMDLLTMGRYIAMSEFILGMELPIKFNSHKNPRHPLGKTMKSVLPQIHEPIHSKPIDINKENREFSDLGYNVSKGLETLRTVEADTAKELLSKAKCQAKME